MGWGGSVLLLLRGLVDRMSTLLLVCRVWGIALEVKAMNQPEELHHDLAPAQPWAWKKIRRWSLALFISFVAVFEWGMQQPWGEVVPGVRLEPLSMYSRNDVTPVSFAGLLEQAGAELKKVVLDEATKAQHAAFSKSKLRPWATADFPELDSAVNTLSPAFECLDQAAEQPIEACLLPMPEDVWFFPVSECVNSASYLSARASRSLESGDYVAVEATILTELKLMDRLQNSSLMGTLVGNALGNMAYALARHEAAQLKDPADFQRLENLLHQAGVRERDLAEVLRWELRSNIQYQGVKSAYYTDPAERLEPVAFLIGSRKPQRQQNLRVAFSHAIAAVEKDPRHGNPGTALLKFTEVEPAWTVFVRPDPITRIGLKESAKLYERIFQETLRLPEAHRSLTLALLAIYQHKLKTGAWPQKLTDAMAAVPMDPFSEPPVPIAYRLAVDAKSWELSTQGEPKVSSSDLEPIANP